MRLRRRKPAPQPPRVDADRIAVLEHELLDVEHQPGSREAYAVAASATPIDPADCAHDDVVDITELGQSRHTGLCTRCSARMIEDDEGEWVRP